MEREREKERDRDRGRKRGEGVRGRQENDRGGTYNARQLRAGTA